MKTSIFCVLLMSETINVIFVFELGLGIMEFLLFGLG